MPEITTLCSPSRYKLKLKHWIGRKSDAVYGSHVRIDIDIITGSIRDNYLINQDIDLVSILTQLSEPAPALSYLPHINFHELPKLDPMTRSASKSGARIA